MLTFPQHIHIHVHVCTFTNAPPHPSVCVNTHVQCLEISVSFLLHKHTQPTHIRKLKHTHALCVTLSIIRSVGAYIHMYMYVHDLPACTQFTNTLTHSETHTLTHTCTHSLPPSISPPPTHSLTHTHTYAQTNTISSSLQSPL